MQLVCDSLLIETLVCCSVLLMLGLSWRVRRWGGMFSFLVASWIILLGILIAGIYCVNYASNITKEGLQDNLSGLAKSFAISLKDAGHENITFDTPDDDPLYIRILDMMSVWHSQIPVAASIYTCRKDAKGKIAFICCPPADLDRDGKFEGEKEELVPKGTVYEYESDDDILEILDAFAGKSGFNAVPILDDWGLWITATEPIFDKSGEHVDAILGVDFWGDDWNTYIRRATFWPKMFLLMSVTLFFVVQIFTIRRQLIGDKLAQYAAALERTMDELVVAKKTADAAAHAKSLFLANISHEIRTPMNAILGCVDMLVRAKEGMPAPLDQGQMVDIIQKSSENLSTVIDDVLTYSSIETRRIVLESVPIDLRQLVDDVQIMSGNLLEEKPELQFRVEWEDTVPNEITGDPTRIRQILLALINNAIKFTEIGRVTVRCSSIRVSDAAKILGVFSTTPSTSHLTTAAFLSPQIANAMGLRGMVHASSAEIAGLQTTLKPSQISEVWKTLPSAQLLQFDVSDTGIGIAKEQLEALFKPFTQADNSSTRKFGGVGLGLSIVKGIVELMGGDVKVTSAPGLGSTFSVFIPVSGGYGERTQVA